jgi:hypothetical protein
MFMLFVLIFSTIASSYFIGYLALYIERGNVDMEWSFGQVVAVSVWLPTVLSFINDCLYGPLRGRTNQLPASLQVVRTPAKSSESLPKHNTIRSSTENGPGRSSVSSSCKIET